MLTTMRHSAPAQLLPPRGWWPLALLALILFIRFPVKFALEPPYLMDFEVYRTVATRLADGQAAHLYEPTTSELMPFKYAPCWALLWLPLAWLPSHLGAVLWASLTVGWLMLACVGSQQLCQRAGLRAPPWLAVMTVGLLVRAVSAEFLNGQVDLLWALLVIGFLMAELSRHPWWAAMSLALASALKLPALIFVPYLLVRGRLQTAARTACLLLAVNLATSLLLDQRDPLSLFQAWLQVLWSSGASRAFEIGNQSLWALLGRFLSADPYQLNLVTLSHPAVLLIGLGVAAALFGLVVIQPSTRVSEPARLVFDGSLLTILMVLCSPTVWIATYSALLLPMTAGLACVITAPRRLRSHLPSALAVMAVVALSLMTHKKFWNALSITYLRGESYIFLVLMTFPWLGLALFWLVWLQRRWHAARLTSSSADTSGS